jgi:hypothetical protein
MGPAHFPWGGGGAAKKFAYKLTFKPFMTICIDRPELKGYLK